MIIITKDHQIVKFTRAPQIVSLLSAVGLLAACGSDGGSSDPTSTQSSVAASSAVEQQSATPRLAYTHENGIEVLDAESLEPVSEVETEGFIRLNPADDGRHLFVSQSDGFTVFDMGTWTRQHGDHGHYYTAPPAMTDLKFGGEEPGHVVPHDGRITLFSDGTGEIDVVPPAELSRGNAESEKHQVPPHHGVAVAREDGTLVTTVGTEESRNGIQILGPDNAVLATNDQCPGIHGEAMAADGTLAFGCQDGLLILRGNDIRKVTSPDPYGRIGNQAGSESSPVVLGDYKVDKNAELERPTRVTLTNTESGELKLVELGTSYSFRSLGRGPNGEALVLGTDGDIHVIDPQTAAVTRKIEAVGDWTEPVEWQDPRPTLFVMDSVAYVTDPNANKLVAVDLTNGTKIAETQLDNTPNELSGVSG
ncbi:zinc metallochaperone AztD [Williamsia muralis]|uniref:zinc metallochaperone AztD n=1 Tax=Williamsia marianensis TaxID=85044 RepID=UPI0038214FF0